MQLQSNDFKHQGYIPSKFTCDGQDISPHLQWTDMPKGTKSFALSCNDPDAPGGDWDHWLVVNIPAATTEIPQGKTSGEEIINDFGKTTYGGPCPPSGQHRYFFTLYALSTARIEDVNKENFMEKISGFAIDSAALIGLYQRN